jgi:hypothetical protein
MASVVDIPWYANGFRGDKLEAALRDVGPTALRYCATAWAVHRSRDDRYKFTQIAHFEEKLDFERWWSGPEMTEFRAITSGWYQVPVFYAWNDLIGEGRVSPEPPHRNGGSNGGGPNGHTPTPDPDREATLEAIADR